MPRQFVCLLGVEARRLGSEGLKLRLQSGRQCWGTNLAPNVLVLSRCFPLLLQLQDSGLMQGHPPTILDSLRCFSSHQCHPAAVPLRKSSLTICHCFSLQCSRNAASCPVRHCSIPAVRRSLLPPPLADAPFPLFNIASVPLPALRRLPQLPLQLQSALAASCCCFRHRCLRRRCRGHQALSPPPPSPCHRCLPPPPLPLAHRAACCRRCPRPALLAFALKATQRRCSFAAAAAGASRRNLWWYSSAASATVALRRRLAPSCPQRAWHVRLETRAHLANPLAGAAVVGTAAAAPLRRGGDRRHGPLQHGCCRRRRCRPGVCRCSVGPAPGLCAIRTL